MLYRIVTERKNAALVAAIAGSYFDGFTMIEGNGVWKGERELSLIVEIETEDLAGVEEAARVIKGCNDQKAVMIQQIDNHAWFV